MKHLLYITIIFFTLYANAQQLPENLKDIDHKILNEHILSEINILRKKKRTKALTNDIRLTDAAKDHAEYLNAKKTLTHKQTKKAKKNPWDRIRFYNLDFHMCGENIQYIYPNSPPPLKKETESSKPKTYERLARILISIWAGSKGHYLNMIKKEFTHTYVITEIDEKDERLYAVQLFTSYL